MEHANTPSKFFPKHLTTILLYFLLQLVPESPRFYMAAGKPEKALCILQKIAKENNNLEIVKLFAAFKEIQLKRSLARKTKIH